MKCRRCGRLMVREEGIGRAYGSDSVSSITSFQTWRCLICGNTLDPQDVTILLSPACSATSAKEFSSKTGPCQKGRPFSHRATRH